MTNQGYINHVGLVLDASGSMDGLSASTIKVADNQVHFLATRSKETDQETRMTVYTFDDKVKNVYYDKDVLRLPSIAKDYRIGGQTALIDATMQAILDLKQTATIYGDHAFLLYVLTDGYENASRKYASTTLRTTLDGLPDNWTIAVLAPNQNSVFSLKQLGFPAGNIAVWETTQKGIEEVGRKIQAATDNYMTMRTQGVRSTRGLFDFDKADVKVAIQTGALKALNKNEYGLYPVPYTGPIRDIVEQITGQPYKIGATYYQLTKSEEIQRQKQVAIQDKNVYGAVYTGAQARQILGLPDYGVTVRAVDHPEYDIYIQSTSVNRKLLAGTNILVIG